MQDGVASPPYQRDDAGLSRPNNRSGFRTVSNVSSRKHIKQTLQT